MFRKVCFFETEGDICPVCVWSSYASSSLLTRHYRPNCSACVFDLKTLIKNQIPKQESLLNIFRLRKHGMWCDKFSPMIGRTCFAYSTIWHLLLYRVMLFRSTDSTDIKNGGVDAQIIICDQWRRRTGWRSAVCLRHINQSQWRWVGQILGLIREVQCGMSLRYRPLCVCTCVRCASCGTLKWTSFRWASHTTGSR